MLLSFRKLIDSLTASVDNDVRLKVRNWLWWYLWKIWVKKLKMGHTIIFLLYNTQDKYKKPKGSWRCCSLDWYFNHIWV